MVVNISATQVKSHVTSDRHSYNKDKQQFENTTFSRMSEYRNRLLQGGSNLRGLKQDCTRDHYLNRWWVAQSLMYEGISFNRLNSPSGRFQRLIERGWGSISYSHLGEFIPLIHQMEIDTVRDEIGTGSMASVIFDGSCVTEEMYIVIVRWVESSTLAIKQRVAAAQLLDVPPDGESLAVIISDSTSSRYHIAANRMLAFIRDGASVNTLAVDGMMLGFKYAMDITCISHTANLTGNKLNAVLPRGFKFSSDFSALLDSNIAISWWKMHSTRQPHRKSMTRWGATKDSLHDCFVNFDKVVAMITDKKVKFSENTRKSMRRQLGDINNIDSVNLINNTNGSSSNDNNINNSSNSSRSTTTTTTATATATAPTDGALGRRRSSGRQPCPSARAIAAAEAEDNNDDGNVQADDPHVNVREEPFLQNLSILHRLLLELALYDDLGSIIYYVVYSFEGNKPTLPFVYEGTIKLREALNALTFDRTAELPNPTFSSFNKMVDVVAEQYANTDANIRVRLRDIYLTRVLPVRTKFLHDFFEPEGSCYDTVRLAEAFTVLRPYILAHTCTDRLFGFAVFLCAHVPYLADKGPAFHAQLVDLIPQLKQMAMRSLHEYDDTPEHLALWWCRHAEIISVPWKVVYMVGASCQPTSCAAERGFSVARHLFSSQQGRALQDFQEGSLMGRVNETERENERQFMLKVKEMDIGGNGDDTNQQVILL